ncbi:nuclear GTPase SLIP-GC-like isoform X1 [Ctenopharyngodon idella]|uniref:nuclear GTPase SLIP-GC-like isoform X1 n=1 Tax=Ctenopharyngodon idella TaxID=7959 RepID=UPI002231860F|nr:nuclear GTPase SLIP-GC-like isoform X1 [Ctenopharyngodon idella]
MASQGTKRKRDHESSVSGIESPLTTAMEIMENAKKIMDIVNHNLDQAFLMNRDIISKINQMNKVSRKKATMGIFGKSGDGKSSLLNAVLGKRDFLPSDSYGACTAIITQVEANLTDSNYIAEIELFSKEEWEKELKDLFRVLSDESEDRDDELFETTVEKITALYGADAKKKTLEELKKDDKFAEIETILYNTKKTISNTDVSEFTNDVASYIQHSESSSGDWYWPLVKSVTIKIPDCHELLEHVVLVDIPGTGDCNKMRDDLWKSKLRECSFVWIVSAINRAIKDKEPWGILKYCIEELGPGGKCKRINFICTKTDEINPQGYFRSARLTGGQLTRDKKKVCILHRNERAKVDVKERLKNSDIKKILNTDNDFEVFTVSSNAFFDHELNLEHSETEIPKLQDDLRILNKNIKRELTRDYVNEAKGVLSLIQSVQLDTEKKTAETKASIHTELKKNLLKERNKLDKCFVNIHKVLEQCLSKGVEKSVQSCVATTKDKILHNKDGRRFHKILQSLCKNGGCYLSKNRDVYLDLNKELAKNLHECLQDDFKKIFPVHGKTGKSLQEEIDKFSIIQSASAPPRSSLLRHIQKYIRAEETQLKARLNREIVETKKEIYSSIQKTIEKEMASYYEEAAAVTGIGSMKKRQEMLITTVDVIKHDMFNKAKKEVLKKFNNLKLYINDALKSELKKSMELSLLQTSKITLMDVSRETEQLETLSGQLERLSEQ